MSDPLVGTLAVLPLVLLGLWSVGHWLRARDGQTGSASIDAFSACVLGVLIVVILGRHHLGLAADSPDLDPLLAGGLALLLIFRVAVLVAALAQSSESTAGSRPPWPFLMLPLVVYIAILPWSAGQREPDGDEPYYLLIAHSLTYDFDTDLTNNYADQDSRRFMSRVLEPSWADPVRDDGSLYSRHGLVLPLVLAPAYRIAGKRGALLTMALMSALAAWLSLSLAWRYWGSDHASAAVTVWALLAFTPPLLLYSHQVWVEVPAAVLVLLALLRIQDLRGQGGSRRWQWLILGVVLILLPLLKLRLVLLSLSLLVLAWWRSGGSRRSAVWVGAALALGISAILIFNLVVFDNPFKDHTLDQLLQIQGRSPADYVRGLIGLFWDCAFGLLASNPLWLMLAPALCLLTVQRSPMVMDLMVCIIPYLVVVSPRREWYGAWAPPFRFGMVLLPLLALILVPLLKRRLPAGARGLIVALGLAALCLTLLWVVVPGWTYNLAAGTNHLIDRLAVRLGQDVGRFLPSLVRLRTASWLVPLLVTPLAVLFWWFPRRRPERVGLWAASILLLLVAALPVAASRVPTTRIEFEDHQVRKVGGQLHPEPWAPYRPRFRGGWKLLPGESVRAPVVPGGETFAIELEVRPVGGPSGDATVKVLAGSRELGTRPLEPGRGWQTLFVEGRGWPGDAELVVHVHRGDHGGRHAGVILDRARFSWD